MQYKSKPVLVNAWQFLGQMESCPDWLKGPNFTLNDRGQMCVYSFDHNNWLDVPTGNWVIFNGRSLSTHSAKEFRERYELAIDDVVEEEKPNRKNFFGRKSHE